MGWLGFGGKEGKGGGGWWGGCMVRTLGDDGVLQLFFLTTCVHVLREEELPQDTPGNYVHHRLRPTVYKPQGGFTTERSDTER